MKRTRTTPVVMFVAFAAAGTAAIAAVEDVAAPQQGQRPVVLRPHEIHWEDRDHGVRVAVLHGDPARPGPFVLRLEYPAGYRKAPHVHPHDAYVTVLEGSYFRGYGPVVREDEAYRLTPGTFSLNPAGVSHYEWTTEPAVLEVHAVGPWATVYVDGEGHPVSGQ